MRDDSHARDRRSRGPLPMHLMHLMHEMHEMRLMQMMMHVVRGKPRSALLIAVCTAACSAPAALAAPEFGAELGVEARATDNVALESGSGQDDIVYTPELALSYAQQVARVEISSAYLLQQRYFQEDSFPSDSIWTGTTAITTELVPNRLRWNLDHSRDQLLRDPRNVNNPENQQEIQNLGSSLELAVLATGRNRFDLQGGVNQQSGAQFGIDSLRYDAGASFSRRLSTLQQVGLSADWLDVDYDDPIPGFQRYGSFVTFDRQGRRYALNGRVGYNWIDRTGSERTGGSALSLGGQWELTARQTLSLSASRQLTDRSAQLDFRQPVPGFFDGLEEAEFNGEIFEETTMTLGYRVATERWSGSLSASWSEDDFEVEGTEGDGGAGRGLDQTRLRYGGALSYRLTRDLTLAANLSLETIEFSAEDRDDDLFTVGVDLRWQLGPRTSVSAGLRREERESSGGPGGGPGGGGFGGLADFEENAVILSIRRTLI